MCVYYWRPLANEIKLRRKYALTKHTSMERRGKMLRKVVGTTSSEDFLVFTARPMTYAVNRPNRISSLTFVKIIREC